MNILQLRSNISKIKNDLVNYSMPERSRLYSTVYKLADIVEDAINTMDENEKGKLVSEVSVAGETYRTYVTNEKISKRQRAIESLIKHAESLDW